MVERAGAEQRSDRDGVDRHREALAAAVGEQNQQRAGDERNEECVLVKMPAEFRLDAGDLIVHSLQDRAGRARFQLASSVGSSCLRSRTGPNRSP